MVGGLYVLQGIEGSSEAVSSGVSGGGCIACSMLEAEGADDDVMISIEGSRWLCHIHWTRWVQKHTSKLTCTRLFSITHIFPCLKAIYTPMRHASEDNRPCCLLTSTSRHPSMQALSFIQLCTAEQLHGLRSSI